VGAEQVADLLMRRECRLAPGKSTAGGSRNVRARKVSDKVSDEKYFILLTLSLIIAQGPCLRPDAAPLPAGSALLCGSD
jgi:hypothetical protein